MCPVENEAGIRIGVIGGNIGWERYFGKTTRFATDLETTRKVILRRQTRVDLDVSLVIMSSLA